ncbi:MAG: mechanosensitive ion channel domain-containing protein [Phormidesmis sp.]
MNSLTHLLINPYVAAYVLILVGSQVLYHQWQQHKRDRIHTQRLTRGLPSRILLTRTEQLTQRRAAALHETLLLFTTIIVVPIVLVGIAHKVSGSTEIGRQSSADAQNGLGFVVLCAIGLVLLGGSPAIIAFVSGLAYKIVAAFSVPFQIDDYVTIKGISGRVTLLNAFFVQLKTVNGQRVNLPTHTLWREPIVTLCSQLCRQSSGQLAGRLSGQLAGQLAERRATNWQATLCEMVFYLSPTATSEQHALAENIIRETARSSAYIEPSWPVEIYYAQSPEAIALTTTAYVTAIEHSAAFRSDITRQFLAFADRQQIPLAIAIAPL